MGGLHAAIYRVIIGVSGSLVCIMLFCIMDQYIPQSRIGRILSSVGQNTLGIYLLQVIIIEDILKRFIKCDGVNFYLFNFVIAPLISLLVLLVCVSIIKIIKRSRWASFFLLGKPFKY